MQQKIRSNVSYAIDTFGGSKNRTLFIGRAVKVAQYVKLRDRWSDMSIPKRNFDHIETFCQDFPDKLHPENIETSFL